ncbi:hypothetical protein CP04DC42_0722A, partial [Chlamydia psittaci 04DC42]
MTLAGATP